MRATPSLAVASFAQFMFNLKFNFFSRSHIWHALLAPYEHFASRLKCVKCRIGRKRRHFNRGYGSKRQGIFSLACRMIVLHTEWQTHLCLYHNMYAVRLHRALEIKTDCNGRKWQRIRVVQSQTKTHCLVLFFLLYF